MQSVSLLTFILLHGSFHNILIAKHITTSLCRTMSSAPPSQQTYIPSRTTSESSDSTTAQSTQTLVDSDSSPPRTAPFAHQHQMASVRSVSRMSKTPTPAPTPAPAMGSVASAQAVQRSSQVSVASRKSAVIVKRATRTPNFR